MMDDIPVDDALVDDRIDGWNADGSDIRGSALTPGIGRAVCAQESCSLDRAPLNAAMRNRRSGILRDGNDVRTANENSRRCASKRSRRTSRMRVVSGLHAGRFQ